MANGSGNENDTDGARVIGGVMEDDGETVTGSSQRLEPKTGDLTYSEKNITPLQESYAERNNFNLKYDGGNARKMALALGLPERVRGDPLGCTCHTAHLVGATKPVGSHVEADYMCDSGYHNYMLFELIGFEQKPETQLKIGPNGELVEDVDEETKELGDY